MNRRGDVVETADGMTTHEEDRHVRCQTNPLDDCANYLSDRRSRVRVLRDRRPEGAHETISLPRGEGSCRAR